MNTKNQTATEHAPHSKTAYCCFIGCNKPATKHISSPPWSYDDYTHSCDDHVEDLKSTDNDLVQKLEETC